jgi:hypothetical protein
MKKHLVAMGLALRVAGAFCSDYVLNNTDLLADTIAEYSDAYDLPHSHSFVLQGILIVADSWVVWCNHKEIRDSSDHCIHINGQVVEIVNVRADSVTFRWNDREISVGVGRSYNLKNDEFADF